MTLVASAERAEAIHSRLIEIHGLVRRPVIFRVNMNMGALGKCHYPTRPGGHFTVEWGHDFVYETGNFEEWVDTVKHELAHVYCDARGHGPEWQSFARMFGCSPSPYGKVPVPTKKNGQPVLVATPQFKPISSAWSPETGWVL